MVSKTQVSQNLPEIPLSIKVFEINDSFNLRPNLKWQPKLGKFDNFQKH